MLARVHQFRIRPGKLEEFIAAIDSMIPLLHQQKGFKALLVLRGETAPGVAPEITAITTWDSLDSLRASEENLYYYRGLAKVLAFSEGFPALQEEQVLVSDFAGTD
ncbi:MAG TPA: antibiotic biosynthesis monooxygenase family protein [Candidatus Acidoferrales bacterium]|nr:antibiotic biosynthesis monooxygenase family protein [Candidatus Acidoferrales bacterium]